MEVLNEYGQILLILAIIFGVFMAWGVGANDVANAMGTSVGSGAITLKQAIIIAMIFEFAGAYLAGGEVTATIRKGIIDPLTLQGTPEYLVYGMLSALLAADLAIDCFHSWLARIYHSFHCWRHCWLCCGCYFCRCRELEQSRYYRCQLDRFTRTSGYNFLYVI